MNTPSVFAQENDRARLRLLEGTERASQPNVSTSDRAVQFEVAILQKVFSKRKRCTYVRGREAFFEDSANSLVRLHGRMTR